MRYQRKEEYGLVSRGSAADLMVNTVDSRCAAAFYRLCIKLSNLSYLKTASQFDTVVHLCTMPACLSETRTPSGLTSKMKPIQTSHAGKSAIVQVVHVSGNDCLFMSAWYSAASSGAYGPPWNAQQTRNAVLRYQRSLIV